MENLKLVETHKINPSEHLVISLGEPCQITQITHHLGKGTSTVEFVRSGERIKRLIPFDDALPCITYKDYCINKNQAWG